jgi:hypothetical protein
MRNNVSVELKYAEDAQVGEDDKLDESKEEETPLSQIAKVVYKNGKQSPPKNLIVNYRSILGLSQEYYRRDRRRDRT